MLSTISGGVVASLLTKFMFLYDDKTKFYGKNLAQFIRQQTCEAAVPSNTATKYTAARFHELGSLLRVRTREHI